MSGERWVVNSEHSWRAFCVAARKLYDEYHHITFLWRIGADRSFDQNALFHVWCREWVAYKLEKPPKLVNKTELAGMKRTVKKIFYQNTGAHWIVHRVRDYSVPNGKEVLDYTSSRDWGRGEMFDVLSFLQRCAAEDGLVLESLGEFAKLQRKQVAV